MRGRTEPLESLIESGLSLDEEERILQTELSRLEAVKKVRRKTSGIDYYIPNPIQYKAHQSKAKKILLCGANRIGKSVFGAVELVWALTKRYPSWFPKERRYKGPIKAVISVDKYSKITTVIEPKLIQYLPKGYYKLRRRQGYLYRVECQDGSTVDILTLEMDDLSYEGFDVDFVWEDEPQSQRKREGLLRGLVDRGGQEIITFTPLTEAWMKDELIDKADGTHIDCYFASMRDNKFDLNGNTILTEQSIQDFERTLPEEIKEIRVDGKFFTLRGRIYKEFGEEHQLDFTYNTKVSKSNRDPVICVLDPHDRLPHHLIWAFVDPTDDVYVDYELEIHAELPKLAKIIQNIEKERGYRMKKRLIDPNFGLKPSRPGSNLSVKDELARYGTGFYPANDDIELGHMIVRDYLHWDKTRPQSATNKPKVFFSKSRTPVTIKSMRNLQYEEWQGKTRDRRDPKEAQQQKNTHGSDCMRYLLVSKPRFGGLHEGVEYELEANPY